MTDAKMVPLHVMIPASWRREINQGAKRHGVNISIYARWLVEYALLIGTDQAIIRLQELKTLSTQSEETKDAAS